MSQSRYTYRGAGSIRSMSRRIKRRGVLGSVKRMPQRTVFAAQRTRWAYAAMLAEIDRMEQEEAAVKVTTEQGFSFELTSEHETRP